MVKGTNFLPPPPSPEDLDEVSRDGLDQADRAKRKQAQAERAEGMTRRSWYTSAEATEALANAVDDIHFATRAPKHEIVAELFKAAVGQRARVEKHFGHVSHE